MMNRKHIGIAVAVVVGLLAVWLLWLRGDDEPKPDAAATGSGRSGEIKPAVATPKAQEAPAPRGRTPMWSLDIDPEGPLRLEGQVLGPDGAGVAKAEVWLSSVPRRTTITEDDGSFSFDKLVGRSYALGATSGDLIGGPVTYKLTDSSDPVVIRIVEGASVIVTVVDDAKQPVAGAELSAGRRDEVDAKTDDKGEATVKPVRPGWVRIEANAPGYAASHGVTTVGSSGATARLTISMKKGYAVSGRVTDENGQGIAKARVSISGGGWGWDGLGDAPKDHATTDAKGAFTIAAIAPGTHMFAAVDGEHAPARSTPVTISDRPVSGVSIVMQAGGVLAGTVVDTGGKPVPFATVRVAGTGQQMWSIESRQATSDRKGAFELKGLARAKLQARAESETAASKLTDVDLTEQAARRDLTLVLDVDGAISGVVIDDKGTPVPEVQVNAFPDILGGASMEGLALAGMSSTTTDGAGAFTIQGLPDGAYRLWAARSSSGAQEWGQSGTSAKTGDTNVRITLAAAGAIKGTVVLAGATSPPKLVNVQAGGRPPTPAQDGAFEVREVTPGTYDVTFRGPEFAEMVKRDIKVEPGKTTDMGTVTVHRGRKLVGKVVDKAGRPVAGAKIKVGDMLFSVDGQDESLESFESVSGIRSAISDQDGAFAIIGVPVKSTSVAADHPERGRSLAVPVPGGPEAADPPPVTLTLRGYGSIAGKVVEKGKPQANVTISQSTKNGGAQMRFAQTDDTGSFTLTKVPEGTIVLQAMQAKGLGTSMKNTTVNVQVTAGKQTQVTIEIPVGTITLAVHVKAAPNQKIDAAQVFLFSGQAVPANAKQLTESFVQGGAQGMQFWFGGTNPPPEFKELVPGEYSACTIPITGNMQDQQFMQRLQENMETLKVYCKQVRLKPAPTKQTLEQEVPAMTPLPTPPAN